MVGIEVGVDGVYDAECVTVGMRSKYRCAGLHRAAPPAAEFETHLRLCPPTYFILGDSCAPSKGNILEFKELGCILPK